jgi:uncharacterized Ntn-hydrolase superfamily protein
MTFSIVAVDRTAKEVGFAIASCCWDAGQVCMARAEAGAMASQANGNVAFLPRFFDGLARGDGPTAILADFRTSDLEIESRQIGMISYDGQPLAFTGAKCNPWAGHRVGEDYSIQGNILVGSQVVNAMAEAFRATDGTLYNRLYAALAAGDDAGGDRRGRESARLAVKKRGCGEPGTDAQIDITIEDHANPVAELCRILSVRSSLLQIFLKLRAFAQAAGADKPAILIELHGLLDDKRDCRYLDWWESLAMAYHEIGDIDAAVEAFRVYLGINPALRVVLEEDVERGTFPADLAARLFAQS